MSTHSLQLLDFPVNYKISPIVIGPRAYIALKTYGTTVWRDGKKEIEFTTISPECVTPREFEYEVDRLIKELETIKKQRKKFFQKELEKRKKHIENKS
ncbi:MAG: hypothetical protein ACYDIC_04885 [Desulfobaccales bacterium]